MEKELVDKCILGDRQAQRLLYEKYSKKIRTICLRYARTKFEAEDILQETFIKIFQNLGKYNFSGPLEAWIRRIALNTAIDTYRSNLLISNQVSITSDAELEDTNSISILDQMSEKELLKLLTHLPDGYRIVFNMYAIEGYSHKEIAATLGINEGTSKSQLSKARNHIKGLIITLQKEKNGL